MKSQWTIAAAIGASSVVFAGVAGAQDVEKDRASGAEASKDLAPANSAVELSLATGYEQGFGGTGSGQPKLTDIAQAGGAVQLGVGYRLIPQLALGLYGSGAAFARGDQGDSSANIYSASAGVKADWHFLPAAHVLDPWVSLGTGWRGYWVHADQGASAGTTAMHGWEIANVQLGLDYRIDRALALSPVVGVDVATFFTQSVPGGAGFKNISSPEVNAFLFVGVQGRLDISTRSEPSSPASQIAAR